MGFSPVVSDDLESVLATGPEAVEEEEDPRPPGLALGTLMGLEGADRFPPWPCANFLWAWTRGRLEKIP